MSASLESRLRALDRRAGAFELIAAGGAVLALLWLMGGWVSSNAGRAATERVALSVVREDLELDLAERQALRDLVTRDFVRAKASATTLSKSRKALFEGGLALSEEKRLLEKQLEIMSLWIRLDVDADRVHLMRGDQIAETLGLAGARPRTVPETGRPLPKAATIISKERFASTERPKSDSVGGLLQWEPPQVGTSVRANALGEFVLFTKEGLILHGPPLKLMEHEAYPHLCLALPRAAASRLYSQSFIGTKILLESPKP